MELRVIMVKASFGVGTFPNLPKRIFTHRQLMRAFLRNFIGVSYSVLLLPLTKRAMTIIAARRAKDPMYRIISVPRVVVSP